MDWESEMSNKLEKPHKPPHPQPHSHPPPPQFCDKAGERLITKYFSEHLGCNKRFFWDEF